MRSAIYLDYAAATPQRAEVTAAMASFAALRFHNPNSVYLAGRAVSQAVVKARAECAMVLGCRAGEIIFTSGSSESINTALAGVLRRYPAGRVALAAGEHAAVANAAEGFAPGRVDQIDLEPSGLISPRAVAKAIRPETVMVSVSYANSETGAVQPLNKLVKVAKTKNPKILFHTDASAAGYLPLKVSRLGVDLLSLGGGKIYGPKSSGLLYVKAGVKLEPLIYGGGQEAGRRGGTQDAGSIVGLARALTLIQTEAPDERRRLAGLRDWLGKDLQSISGVKVLPVDKSLPNMLVLTMPVKDAERLVMELDEAGVQAGTGAACSANSDKPSPALLAMGLSPSAANRTLRLSLGQASNEAEIKRALKIIATVVQK